MLARSERILDLRLRLNHVPLPASCWSQPSLAGRARRQVSFLSEAIIEKRRSSANLVHQGFVRSSFDSRETTRRCHAPHGSSQFIVNAGTQRRAQPLTGNCFDLRIAKAWSDDFAEVERIKFDSRFSELTIVDAANALGREGNICNCTSSWIEIQKVVVRQGALNFLSWQP